MTGKAAESWKRQALAGWRLAREGRPFEAHEAWEELWLELRGDDKLWVQALIQLAVADLHDQAGNAAGCASLLEKAEVKLGRLAGVGHLPPPWAAGLPDARRLLGALARAGLRGWRRILEVEEGP